MVPLAEVKTYLSELVGRVHDHHERVTVTVHGRPSAVLIAVEDLERLEATLEVLGDPATLRRLAEADAELARGEGVSEDELAAVMPSAARSRDRSRQRAVHASDRAIGAASPCATVTGGGGRRCVRVHDRPAV
ncbi:type II toxin-antitoxin system Phd/YefM family antitoxin [Cryptosporangium sp. NPDC048952]|uniref:type II toxin-antitoxin system Phd/YefM family antitoxin n=1 Tax=Cryptosporangium sp. NPDC048952 TaxID=3363961 RepID=UPI0037124FC2